MEQNIQVASITEADYDTLYRELTTYKVSLSASPTPGQLLEQIAMVQAYRTRVSQMLIDSIIIRRKLKNQWLVYWDNELPLRNEKSAEQREAGVRNKFRIFYEIFKRSEDYYEIVSQVYRDLVDANNNIARQAHILEQEMRLTSSYDPKERPLTSQTSWDHLTK